MALAEILSCAPWRQSAPRALSAFEWEVVRTAMARSMDEASFGLGQSMEPDLLVAAIAANPCPAWRTSVFSPAPAVATFWFKCFATWYASAQTPGARAAIRTQIGQGLLCAPNAPWASCRPTSKGTGAAELWEGGPQIGSRAVPFAEPCAAIRQRTLYTPVSGRDLVKLIGFLGPNAALPPGLTDLAGLAPALFLDRQFLLGIQARASFDLAAMGQLGDNPVGAALALVEDAALLWGPGQGASVLDFLKGPIDVSRLLALFNQMSPDLVGQVLGQLGAAAPGLAAALPGLIQQYGPALGGMMQTAGQLLPGLLGPMHGFGIGDAEATPMTSPGTSPTTGIALVDKTEAQLRASPSPGPPGLGASSALLWVGGAVAGAVLLALLVRAAT